MTLNSDIDPRPPTRGRTNKPAADLYAEVTQTVLDALEKGVVPWRMPLRSGVLGDPWPRNLSSGHRYRGLNVFLLALTGWSQGYRSPHWLTFRQAVQRGGHVKKGESSTRVIFWKQIKTLDRDSGKPITIPVLRQYRVFNLEQCEGLGIVPEPPEIDQEAQPIAEAQQIVEKMVGGPRIEHHDCVPCYRPKLDTIELPQIGAFTSPESFYATLYHELGHATGHSKRLDRGLDEKLPPFGSPDYSREELIAEMASAFLCAEAGISPQTIETSAAYLQGWIKALRGDHRLVIRAAGPAQRAADWVLGRSQEEPQQLVVQQQRQRGATR